MMSLALVFYLFLFIFGFAGAHRGWAKELLVIFSIILGLALIAVVETLLPMVGPLITGSPIIQYWVRIGIIMAMTFFGYQSPKLARLSKSVEKKDRIQDVLLGIFMGVLAGYFVVGTLWSFAASAQYPMMQNYIAQPTSPAMQQSIDNLLKIMPPVWLGKSPNIYISVVLAFIFVIVVFI